MKLEINQEKNGDYTTCYWTINGPSEKPKEKLKKKKTKNYRQMITEILHAKI